MLLQNNSLTKDPVCVCVCIYIYIYMANEKVCSSSNKKRIRGQYKKISSLCMCMRMYIYTYIPPKGRKDI